MMFQSDTSRRGFLKQAAVVGGGGIAGVAAVTASTSAATRWVSVTSFSNSDSRYIIKNGGKGFSESSSTESHDWADKRIVGIMKTSGKYDRYRYSSSAPSLLTYVNIADGKDSNDPKIHFSLSSHDNGTLTVSADAGADWKYDFTARNWVSKARKAEGNDSRIENDWVSGRIAGGYQDSFSFGGGFDTVYVNCLNSRVSVEISNTTHR